MKIALLLPLLLTPLAAQLVVDVVVEDGPQTQPEEVVNPNHRDHSSPVTLAADFLEFLNGDRLSGSLAGVDMEAGIRWNHPDAKETIAFSRENIKLIQLKHAGTGGGDLSQSPRVVMSNGDTYRGRIVRMNPEVVVLDTPMAGQVQLKSSMVRAILPESVSTAVYEGPKSIEGWVKTQGGGDIWKYRDGALYSDNPGQMVGMDFKTLPDKVSIEFDLEWKGQPAMMFAFWARDAKNPNQNAYMLNFNYGHIQCYRNHNNQHAQVGNAQVQQLMSKNKTTMKFLLNRETREIMFFVDDNMVASWRDNLPADQKGNAIIFGNQGSAGMKISNINIRSWSGEVKGGEDAVDHAGDRVVTRNGDAFVGTLEKIEQGVLHFRSDFATFQVPMERVAEIGFPMKSRAKPRRTEQDVQLQFPGGEFITLQVDKVDRGILTGKSEAAGDLNLQMAFVHSLQFNPYDARQNLKKEDW